MGACVLLATSQACEEGAALLSSSESPADWGWKPMESNENCMKSTWRLVSPRCILQVDALTAVRAAVMVIGHYLKCVLSLSARC